MTLWDAPPTLSVCGRITGQRDAPFRVGTECPPYDPRCGPITLIGGVSYGIPLHRPHTC